MQVTMERVRLAVVDVHKGQSEMTCAATLARMAGLTDAEFQAMITAGRHQIARAGVS